MEAYHNSRDLTYRSPFGARKCGEEVNISIRCSDDVSEVSLRLWTGDGEEIISMERRDGRFSATVKLPETPQLVWYYFILKSEYETKFYLNNEDCLGGEGRLCDRAEGHSYQITVFSKDFKTPDWFKNSVMYQIFPDRFFRSGKLPKTREEYILHEDWYEPFAFQKHPFENGPACNDFYGGNLKGIEEKLPYLKELGISVVYLNPIFDAYSNHRYDTADYSRIDPLLGTEEDFENLCRKGKEYGIRFILDGVFSHTGSDSVYFNKYGTYGESGAFRDENSPYRKWYNIDSNGSYESWWGCTNLPNVNETAPTYLDYILRDDNAIIKKWIRAGAAGWRLDVADELPEEFIKILRKEVKAADPRSVVIGEVWEDASNKVSYGSLRGYLLGDELDSVMNYPFKDSMIDFILGHIDAERFCAKIMSIAENYPNESLYSLMNIAGTHDTARIKTVLGGKNSFDDMTDAEKWNFGLCGGAETAAIERVMLMAFMQMTFVGVPCIYYGDEIGMDGLSDPYNRKPYTWRSVNPELLDWYKKLIKLRGDNEFLRTGSFEPLYAKGRVFVYLREISDGKNVFGQEANSGAGIFALNCGDEEVTLENLGDKAEKIIGRDGKIILAPREAGFFIKK